MSRIKTYRIILFMGSFVLAILYEILIAMNNIFYFNTITFNFMLYCSLYGAPFIIIDGFLLYKMMQWFNRSLWSQKHEVSSTILQILIVILSSTICISLGFLLFDPNKYNNIYDFISTDYIITTHITGSALNILIWVLAKYVTQIEVSESRVKQLIEVKSELVHTQYQQLKAQVNPHFLFNSLNILISLIKRDQNKATEYTRQLSSIYRYILSNDKHDLVPLDNEIEFSRQYAEIIKIRYGKGININFPDTRQLVSYRQSLIIPTAIQVLIENACKHNIISEERPLNIDIILSKNNISVSNNIIVRKEPADSTGLGLKGLKEKYLLIADQEITINATPEQFKVTIPLLEHSHIENIQL